MKSNIRSIHVLFFLLLILLSTFQLRRFELYYFFLIRILKVERHGSICKSIERYLCMYFYASKVPPIEEKYSCLSEVLSRVTNRVWN